MLTRIHARAVGKQSSHGSLCFSWHRAGHFRGARGYAALLSVRTSGVCSHVLKDVGHGGACVYLVVRGMYADILVVFEMILFVLFRQIVI